MSCHRDWKGAVAGRQASAPVRGNSSWERAGSCCDTCQTSEGAWWNPGGRSARRWPFDRGHAERCSCPPLASQGPREAVFPGWDSWVPYTTNHGLLHHVLSSMFPRALKANVFCTLVLWGSLFISLETRVTDSPGLPGTVPDLALEVWGPGDPFTRVPGIDKLDTLTPVPQSPWGGCRQAEFQVQ